MPHGKVSPVRDPRGSHIAYLVATIAIFAQDAESAQVSGRAHSAVACSVLFCARSVNSSRSTRSKEMSSEGESRGRRSRRVAAQRNASGTGGIPMKKEMSAEELKRFGSIYFEDGLWKRDVLLWRDCCTLGSAM